MSRNVDKANSVLVRFQELQAEESSGYKDYSRYKRPTKLSSVKSLDEAQQWSKQITREIKDKSTRIYDPSLNEVQIRDLNDELNDLLKEQGKWDWYMSHVLGGKRANKRRRDDYTGGKLIMNKRYFGRALELPEVQDFLQRERENGKSEKNTIDTRVIPNDKKSFYYGEQVTDNRLLEFERQWTLVLREKYKGQEPVFSEPLEESGINVPTIEDMESWLVEQRKRKLLEELNL